MPTIVNPYRPDNSLGDVISKVAGEMFGGDQIGSAIRREQYKALSGSNAGREALAGSMAGTGPIDWSVAGPAIINSGYKPGDFNELQLGRNASLFGARDERTQAAQVGAGGPFSATAGAFDASQATERRGQDITSADRKYGVDVTAGVQTRGQDIDDSRGRYMIDTTARQNRYEFDQKPLEAIVDGKPVFVPQTGAFASGVAPMVAATDRTPDQKYVAARELYLRAKPGDEAGADAYALSESSNKSGPSTVVNNNAGGAPDGKLREKLDENEGKRLSSLQAAAATSAGLTQDLGALNELVGMVPTGPVQGRLAEAFPEMTNAGAAFQSIISRAAPGLRVEGSGATSDIEYDGMIRSLPRMRNDPNANRLIIEMMQAKADLNIIRGDIVTDYQNNRISADEMRQRLGNLNRRSILSPGLKAMIGRAGGDVAPAAAESPAIPVGTVEDGFRYRGGDPGQASSWEPAT